jgi:translation elongation factor EF-1beta
MLIFCYLDIIFCVSDSDINLVIVAAKLVAVGYGIKKLQIMLTIVDDLVSVDSLIEEHLTVEPINEYVQSCDIVAFNKICKNNCWVA